MADKKEDVNGLLRHLEVYTNRLNSGMIPERQKDKKEAYVAWLKLEIKRTRAKIEAKTGVPLK